jgi:F1F0 ATPase subunit 2
MKMNELLTLLPAVLAGIALGLFFFGGLWYTIRHLATSHRPALLLLGSFVLRTGLTLLGFYLVMGGVVGAWQRLLAAALGFFLARLLLTRHLGSTPAAERGEP